MHLDLSLLTALAVLFHLGTNLAATVLKDNTDRRKIADLNTKVDQVLTVVQAVAPAVPQAAPKTIAQVAGDLADVATALAALSTLRATSTPGGAQNAG